MASSQGLKKATANSGKLRSVVISFAYGDNYAAKCLGLLEDKFNCPREYSLYGTLAFVILYLSFGWCNDFFCELIALVYPAIRSLNTIEGRQRQHDDTEWLMYWTVYACLRIVDYLRLILLSWFPFYYLIKTTLLVWLMVPGKNGGSHVLYNRLVKPHLVTGHTVPAFDPITDTGRKMFDSVAFGLKSTTSHYLDGDLSSS